MSLIQTPIRIFFIFFKTDTMKILYISIFGYLSLPIVAFILYFLNDGLVLVYTLTVHFSLSFCLYLQYLYALPQ